MTKNELTYIYVTWTDAHAGGETWTNIRDLDQDPVLVRTAGFLLSHSDGGKEGHITIFQSITSNDDVDHVLHIPTAMVKEFKCLQINLESKVVSIPLT
jgi:hypothetical protein